MKITDPFAHLSEGARRVVLDDEARKAYIWSDRWLTYPAGESHANYIVELAQRGPSMRPTSMLLTAPPGTGKSMIGYRALALAEKLKLPPRTIVRMETPTKPTEARLYIEILRALEMPVPVRARTTVLQDAVCTTLANLNTRVLIVDEIQIILSLRSDLMRGAMDTLKFLINQLRITIVGLGTREVQTNFKANAHLAERFQMYELRRWTTPEPWIGKLYKDAIADLPLRKRTVIDIPLMIAIENRHRGVPGRFFEALQEAAIKAIEDGTESLEPKHLIGREDEEAAKNKAVTDLDEAA